MNSILPLAPAPAAAGSMEGLRTVKRKMGAEPTVMLAQLPLYQDMVRLPSLSINSFNCGAKKRKNQAR